MYFLHMQYMDLIFLVDDLFCLTIVTDITSYEVIVTEVSNNTGMGPTRFLLPGILMILSL